MGKYLGSIVLSVLILGVQTANAQQNLAQQASLIFEQSCLGCHGPHGSFTENLVIESAQGLIDSGAVVPGNPDASALYTRLLHPDPVKRMPLGGQLSPQAIQAINAWITAGAPSWEVQHDAKFITTDEMLTAMQQHIRTLDAFDRPFARYFTTTHLYNAGESLEALSAYRVALSKLVNSLSWGFQIINPEPINTAETLFYIDLRQYGWDERNAWPQIENVYPYAIAFDAKTQGSHLLKYTFLQGEMQCDVPFVHVDWFLATAALPPLYHDILALPETERELERQLGIDVERNLRNAPGIRVWRAGTNDSGVSNHNRVVERHTFQYGAYWKSHDFAGSAGAQNIFTHPLSFERDGGEVIFNLPNGLQGYYVADGLGDRIDVAPTEIVSNPAASDPAVRNGLSCIGCHTEGMKTFEDAVRTVIEQTRNPNFNKPHALRLYVEQTVMDDLLEQDTARYRTALEATGGVFGGIEPVHRFVEKFQGPIEAPSAAAAVGLETQTFLTEIKKKSSLQNLGLTGLLSGGNVKRDVWTDQFQNIITALNTPEVIRPEPEPTPDVIIPDPDPITGVDISDRNLRAVIAEILGKSVSEPITRKEMARIEEIDLEDRGITDLTGLEHAAKLQELHANRNEISDLSPLTGLKALTYLSIRDNPVSDFSPLATLPNLRELGFGTRSMARLPSLKGLKKIQRLELGERGLSDISGVADLTGLTFLYLGSNNISDISVLAGLTNLRELYLWENRISDISVLAGLKHLKELGLGGNNISDISVLSELTGLERLYLGGNNISNISVLAGLKHLKELGLGENNISDMSPLAGLTNLEHLDIHATSTPDISVLAGLARLREVNLAHNGISDVSPLAGLKRLRRLHLHENNISDVSPLAGLTNLEYLHLPDNAITDLSPLAKLSEGTDINWLRNPGFSGAPKIAGPWLWVLVPGDDLHGGGDLLAQASGGKVRASQIADNVPKEGDLVGDNAWFAYKINPEDGHNIQTMLDDLGFKRGGPQIIYGLVVVHSPHAQETTMFTGSHHHHKVWLNGKLIDENYHWADDYQKFFPVTLKKGENVLLVSIFTYGNKWAGYFGFAADAEYRVVPPGPKFSLTTEATNIEVGTTFTVNLTAENITDLAGWQTDITFDPTVLKVNRVTEGNFLRQGGGRTYFRKGVINNELGRIVDLSAARISQGSATGAGPLLALQFTAIANGESQLKLRDFLAGDRTGETFRFTSFDTPIVVGDSESVTFPAWDVNEDGVTDATDVALVTAALGQSPPVNPRTDVNSDGVVDGKDLTEVAAHLGEKADPAAPLRRKVSVTPKTLTLEEAEHALDILRAADDGSLMFRHGIANLERILAAFVPSETALLHNYPNPFNPETWIPYQLKEPAEVILRIYATNGTLVRTLDFGHQPAGIYRAKNRAAYWDGKNALGEPVASGVYFYTLTAGDFTATRKMVIRK